MSQSSPSERGNILVYALIGIVLVGLLTVALSQGNDGGKDVGQEQMVIKGTEVQRYAAKVQQGVNTVLQNRVSETDLRFAHPKAPNDYGTITSNPAAQVFHPSGGAAEYAAPPVGVQVAAAPWEFFGDVSLPQIGSDRADLVMVLPDVTQEFCTSINKQLGFTNEDPTPFPDGVGAGGCLNGGNSSRFDDGTFSSSPNVIADTVPKAASFTRTPAPQACVVCGTDYHYYYVLLAR